MTACLHGAGHGLGGGVEYVGVEYVTSSPILGALSGPLVIFGDSSKFTAKNSLKRHALLLTRINT